MAKPGTDKTQKQKFIDKARELGCEEDEETFREKLKRIAKSSESKHRRATPKTKG